ncbi:MAG TPA: CvpA family protein [Acetobacteraceae bacterium]|nr:CvpA family protein [Acetobacteraceae bacterium]
MTWVDLAVLVVLAVSALLAFMRGLVREVLGIGAWIGAGLAAAWGLPLARPQFHQWFGTSPWADPIAFVAIFVVALILLMLVAHAIGRAVRFSPLGGLDRTLGLVFGLVRGAALVIVAYIVAGMVVPVDQWPQPVQQARSLAPAYAGARWVVHQLPVDYRPRLYAPPAGRQATAEALLHATPQGSALGRAAGGPAAARY